MNKNQLRELAISLSLPNQTSLAIAFRRMQFVQADPIAHPAHAQDLVLRHRVNNYKNGDLERNYAKLGVREDFLYAHGFMTQEVWKLLHPRSKVELSEFDQQVLEAVKHGEEINSKTLSSQFGSQQERNWWGGKSQSTRMSLERLQYYGLLEISARQKGMRSYRYFQSEDHTLTVEQRLEKLIMLIVEILAPVTKVTLRQSLHRLRDHFGPTQKIIDNLVASGQLTTQKIEDIAYLWPTLSKPQINISASVRFLAPFDPLVWDRQRFEHLWGWQYRFEAYVPAAKRIRGYYAMPLLWRDMIIGWVNVSRQGNIELGFVHSEPKELGFRQALDREIEEMHRFLEI